MKMWLMILVVTFMLCMVSGIHIPKHEVEHWAYPRYAFDYGVKDPHTGDHKTQWEKREGDFVKGEYSLVEPDGSVRVVEYTADPHHGFNAVVKKIGHGVHPKPLLQKKHLLPHLLPSIHKPLLPIPELHKPLLHIPYFKKPIIPIHKPLLDFHKPLLHVPHIHKPLMPHLHKLLHTPILPLKDWFKPHLEHDLYH